VSGQKHKPLLALEQDSGSFATLVATSRTLRELFGLQFGLAEHVTANLSTLLSQPITTRTLTAIMIFTIVPPLSTDCSSNASLRI
jgi:hypothetical protein